MNLLITQKMMEEPFSAAVFVRSRANNNNKSLLTGGGDGSAVLVTTAVWYNCSG